MDTAIVKAQIQDVEKLEKFNDLNYKRWHENILLIDNR